MPKKISLYLVVFCFQQSLFFDVCAAPSPFGITINESTLSDIKQKYSVKYIGINKYSGGEMYELDPKQIDFDGVQSASIIMSKDDKVLGLLTVMDKNSYDKLFAMLSKKYKLVSNRDPFVGDKEAQFIDGDTNITINARHMGFQLYLRYAHNTFTDLVDDVCAKERAEKNKKEENEL